MTDPYVAVKEFSRVLKSGGIGIFSIPNYSNIQKRVDFLLNGHLTKPKTKDDYEKAGRNLFNFHNSPLTITLLDLIFSINDLEIEEISIDRKKKKQIFYYPLVLLLRIIAKLASEKSRKKHQYALTLRGEVIFGSNTLIFVVKKK
jgi:SAM-dependent methyltransferase